MPASPVLLIVFIAVIYTALQIVKRQTMARHDTFNAFMAAVVSYAAIIGIIAWINLQEYAFSVGATISLFFWFGVMGYFYWDYDKIHKKPKGKVLVEPLVSDVQPKSKSAKRPKPKGFVKLMNWAFFVTETAEATIFLLITPLTWRVYFVGGIPVLTYENSLMLCFFGGGIFLAADVLRRLRHPKKIMEFYTPDLPQTRKFSLADKQAQNFSEQGL